MRAKQERLRKTLDNPSADSTLRLSLRLKKLRHERDLVERAIVALTKLSRSRISRAK